MRNHLVCLTTLALAACAGTPSRAPDMATVPTLDVRRPRDVRLYLQGVPECPFREVAIIAGRNYRELQDRAFQLRANAVILETGARNTNGPYSASAVQFTRPDCQR